MDLVGDFKTVVVGSGIAGLTYALRASKFGKVVVITKKSRADSNTNWAQGGIAAVMSEADSGEAHVQDTLAAGVGLCREDAVRTIVEEGPAAVRSLIDLGASFTMEEDHLDLAMEGGHSRRRIVHAKDRTGGEIERALLAAIESSEQIQVWEHGFVLDLWVGADADGKRRCHGVIFFDEESGRVGVVRGHRTMLATGGCGKVYLYTSNPDIATADGIAMAARAGCTLANLEMVQFHPTCLYHPEAKSFLISEAVRGDGAVLVTADGEPFMEGRHPQGSLAPRDVVAREIDREMKARGDRYVMLDVSKIGPEGFKDRFPSISARLEQYGIKAGIDPIPVVPAAHYMCGGVKVDLHGRTDLPGLFAAGEVAHTGVHGANRLASNSLLEAHVIAARAGSIPPPDLDPAFRPELPIVAVPGISSPGPDRGVILEHEWSSVRRLMWDYVGLVRSKDRLRRATDRLDLMQSWSEDLYRESVPDTDLAEIRNIALVGLLIASSAAARPESRGLHTLLDEPELKDPPVETWARWSQETLSVRLVPLDEVESDPDWTR